MSDKKNTAETPEVTETPKAPEAPQKVHEKLVEIKIPYIPGLPKDKQEDVFVAVNGRSWLIKRGVYVKVPACVAEVLRHQEEMLDAIMEFEAANATEA